MAEPKQTEHYKQSIEPQALAGVALFHGLESGQLEQAAAAAHKRSIDCDEFFFQQEDPAELVYVLVEGRVRLLQVTPDGQEVIQRYACPVDEFGLVAVLTGETYPVAAQAVEDCVALAWDKPAIQQIMKRYPQVALNAIQILANRTREFQDRLREMATERVERRIARMLLRLARLAGRKTETGVLIDLPLSRQDLAEMTGTTLYTASRILSQWETQGLVRSGREQVFILHPHGLVLIAEDIQE